MLMAFPSLPPVYLSCTNWMKIFILNSMIGTMGIPVISIMIMLLHMKYIYGAYIFEKDVSHITRVGTAKKWLVFMEIRIKLCMTIREMSHYPWGDLVGLMRCLATQRTEQQQRCYRDKYKWRVWFHTRYHMSIWRRMQQTKCRCADPLNFTALVHGMFNINVTFLRFKMSDRFGMYSLQDDCSESPTIFKINTDNITYDFCASHFPWRIYFATNRVSLKLDTDSRHEKYISRRNLIAFEIGVLDRAIFHNQYGSHSGMMTWSDFNVRWYRIDVELLCRVIIYAVFTLGMKSQWVIYDGPNENMPQLLNGEFKLNETILSSTFQTFVVHAMKHFMGTSTLVFKAIREQPITLKPPQHIFLSNNSGCGIKNPKTWMCTYHILSPVGTHARLKVISLDISGPYRNMYISAGVAIYNVINQKRSLVAHWHRSLDSDDELIITSTETELYMTVFSYSPFAVLSYYFSIQSDMCIGRFIGRFMRPSMMYIPNCPGLNQYGSIQCLVQFNVTRECFVVQLVYLPIEYPVANRLISIVFPYKEALHIWKHSVGISGSAYSCKISGKFRIIHGSVVRTSRLEIIGNVDSIDCMMASNSMMHIIKVQPKECLLPCTTVRIPVTTINGSDAFCDICAYKWIYRDHHYAVDYLPSYGTITFERINDSTSISRICIESAAKGCASGQEVCYFSSQTTFQFSEQRGIVATVYDTGVWRTQKREYERRYVRYNFSCPFSTQNPVLFRFEAYEYILKNALLNPRASANWTSANHGCLRMDAQLLTVFDRRELNFIINNIMTPYAIEHVFIGMRRQVRKQWRVVMWRRPWIKRFQIRHFWYRTHFERRLHCNITKNVIQNTPIMQYYISVSNELSLIIWKMFCNEHFHIISRRSCFFIQVLFADFSTQGIVSPFTLWNAYTHGRLRKITGDLIRSRLQPGDDGDCASMIISNNKMPSWYSLPCHEIHRWYICKRVAETVLQHLPYHMVSSASYSKCKLREVYAVNGCYFLDQSPIWSTKFEINIEITIKKYLLHLFKILVTVTAMNYQLQLQTSNAKIVGNNKHLCVVIKSNPAIKEGKCIPTNTSKTFSVFAGENIKSVCEYNQIHCDDGTCISQDHSCFDHIYRSSMLGVCGNIDQLVNDQHYCRYPCIPQNCSCPMHYFQCGSGVCIRYTLICDGKTDCIDASDEMCGYLTGIISQQKAFKVKRHIEVLYVIGREHYCLGYQCLSGECIPLVYVNDLIPDCPGGQAEDEKIFLRMFYHKERFDCVDRSQHQCVAGLSVCFPLDKLCVFDLDEEQNIIWCRNGAHLSDCGYINCTNSYKCPQSYCLPFHLVCNGRRDCIHGEDEHMCDDYICKGLLRCKGSRICAHPTQICDGKIHCPQGDDERFCDWKSCATNCTCVGYSLICTGLLDETLPPMHSDYTKHMSVSRSNLRNPHFHNICSQKELIHLNLSDNRIHDICSSLYLDYELYKTIHLLDLSHNMIRTLKPYCFRKMTSLRIISLAYNRLQLIHGDAFLSVPLEYLNIKRNKIREIKAQTLNGISNIGILDICDIQLHSIDKHAQNMLSHVPKLTFSDPRLCCILQHVKICQKLLGVMDHCPKILPHRLIGYIIILIGVFSAFTNAVGLIMNTKFLKDSLHTATVSYLMATNIVLGTYLPLIGSVDLYYDKRIAVYHIGWAKSYLCSFMEVSSSTTLMISLCLNGLLMFMIVGAITSSKLYIAKTRLVVGTLLVAGFALIFNMTQSLFKSSNSDDIEASAGLCNILRASTIKSVPQGVSECVICALMLALFMYMLIGAVTVLRYITKTTKEVLKYCEGDIARNNMRKRMICKRMVELVLVMSFITLPYPSIKALSLLYVDIPQIIYTGVMFSTIILEIFYTPLLYIYIPLLKRIRKRHGWI